MLDPEKRTPKQKRILTDQFVRSSRFNELNSRLNTLAEEYPALTEAPGIAENPYPPRTHVLIRGNFQQPGVEIQPGTLAVLPPLPEGSIPSRLTLARWLVSPDNPLTARVIVNRVWHYHFGRGIAATPSDLGLKGERPTHPELLDWLASEFIAHNWSLKYLHRLILTSRV